MHRDVREIFFFFSLDKIIKNPSFFSWALRREKQKNAKNNKFQRSKTSIVVKRPETAPVKNSQNKLVLEESKSFEDIGKIFGD